MTRIVSTALIDGPPGAVFDLVTTTRFWPRWHPATVGVGGVTERPFALGDKIRERARIGRQVYEGTWAVVEHTRPQAAVLQGEGGRIRIAYSLQPLDKAIQFRRELEFDPADFGGSGANPAALADLMQRQSDQAVQQLKALVETILQHEARLEILF